MAHLSMTEAADPAVVESFFTSDRNFLLDSAFDFGLTAAEFKVYYGLVKLMNEQRQVTTSIEEITKLCQHSRTTVTFAIKSLVAKGLVRQLVYKARSYIHELTSPLDWAEIKSDVQDLNNSDVQNLNITEVKQTTSNNTPPKGGVVEVVVVQKLNNDQKLNNVQKLNNASHTDLNSKLAAARERGWKDTGTWWNDLGEQMVTVNQFRVSVTEFMKRSLDSFHHIQDNCAAGLELCRQQIERIKQRKALSYG